MSSVDGSADGRRDIEIQGKGLDFSSRHPLEANSVSQNVKGKENIVQQDQEVSLLWSPVSVTSKPSVDRRSPKLGTPPEKKTTLIVKPTEIQAEYVHQCWFLCAEYDGTYFEDFGGIKK